MRKALKIMAVVGLIGFAACTDSRRDMGATDTNGLGESSSGTYTPRPAPVPAPPPVVDGTRYDIDASRNNIDTSRESINSPSSDRYGSSTFDDRGTSSSGTRAVDRSSRDADLNRDRLVNPGTSGTNKTPTTPAAGAPSSGSANSPGSNTVTGP